MKILYIILLVILGIVVVFPWIFRGLMWLLQRKLTKMFSQQQSHFEQTHHHEDVVFEDAEVTVLEGDAQQHEQQHTPTKKHTGEIRDANFRDS